MMKRKGRLMEEVDVLLIPMGPPRYSSAAHRQPLLPIHSQILFLGLYSLLSLLLLCTAGAAVLIPAKGHLRCLEALRHPPSGPELLVQEAGLKLRSRPAPPAHRCHVFGLAARRMPPSLCRQLLDPASCLLQALSRGRRQQAPTQRLATAARCSLLHLPLRVIAAANQPLPRSPLLAQGQFVGRHLAHFSSD